MNAKKYIIFSILSFLALKLISCVSPYEPNLPPHNAKLVVSGLLSNLQGDEYNYLNVTYSSPFNNESKDILYPQGAKVYVTDDKGNREDYVDAGVGVFKTKTLGFRGYVARTYTLHIDTPDGKKYESKPEYMKPVPPIDTAYLVFREKLTEKGVPYQRYFDVVVETKDPTTSGDFYRWVWKHYERIAACKVTIYLPPEGGPPVREIHPCCEDICFDIYRCDGCINTASDNLVNGKRISKAITRINYNNASPYYMLFEQFSISTEAFKFWQRVDTQINNSGGIFDTPPATVIGNMMNVNDPDEQVLGYFGVSEIARKAVYLDRSFAYNVLGKQPFNINNVQVIRPFEAPDKPDCFTCKEGFFRTQQPPLGWKQ
jgi:hypothetical protein